MYTSCFLQVRTHFDLIQDHYCDILSNGSVLFNGPNAVQDSKCPTLKTRVTKIMKFLAHKNSKLYFSIVSV